MPIKILNEGIENQKEICVLSYSSYSVYKQCPNRYYREKVLKEPLEKVDETYTIPGRIVHDAASYYFETGSLEKFNKDYLRAELEKNGELETVDYIKAYKSFDKALDLLYKSADNLQTFVETRDRSAKLLSEQWFGTWEEPLVLSENLAIQGAADLIEVLPNGSALLYDYKTSYNTKNLSRDQLMLYAIAAKIKWGIDISMASFFMLPTNKQEYFSFTKEDKQDLLNQLQKTANEILTVREKLAIKKNDKCKYCPFYDSCGASTLEKEVASLGEGTVSFDFNAML